MKYQIVEAQSPEQLQMLVGVEMLSDWEPHGGVTVVALGDDSYLYVQAMIKQRNIER